MRSACKRRRFTWVQARMRRAVVRETLDAIGVQAPPIHVDADAYASRVRARAKELAEIAKGGARLFEVGLRAASCIEQHVVALEACRDAGITRTSHVLGAQR